MNKQNNLECKKLSKKDVFKSYVFWMMFALSCQNMERMEAPAFAGMMGKIAGKLYDNIEDKQALMMRHTQFYNTQPMVGVMINGIALGMEEEKAAGKDVPDEVISSVKTSLMGPFAGIGDSLFIGTLIPILLSIGLGLVGENGSVIGPLFYIAAWLAIMLPFTWLTYKWGYRTGISAISTIYESGIMNKVVTFAGTLGLVIVGCITAQYVNFSIVYQYVSGEMTKGIQGVLDGIFPGMLPLAITLLCWKFLDKRQNKMWILFVSLFVICLLGNLTGVIG